ncbi:hypothetical protein UlMin_014009 [Ulmus minor]
MTGRRGRKIVFGKVLPYFLCIFCNICGGGLYLVSKVSMDKGMSRYVLVAYGYAFATPPTALLAYLFERNNGCKLSIPILRNIFFLALLGSVFARTLFFMGIQCTNQSFASAVANISPSITFILAVLCRMEGLEIRKLATQAKIGGTVVSFIGATIMTLYKGINLISLHSHYSHQTSAAASLKLSFDKDWIKGSIILVVSFFAFSAFYILQTKTVEIYRAPMTLTALTCLLGTLVSAIMTAILDHKADSWKLSWNISLLAPIYSGLVICGLVVYVQTLVIRKKGPVFMMAFSPLATVVSAIMGLLILGEPLHLGSVVGAILIIIGLYAILWGKKKEEEKFEVEHCVSEQDIEIRPEK